MKKNNKQIAIYQAPSGAVEVRLDANNKTIFLTQQQVGALFNVQKAAISKHVKNIFETGELDKKSTVSILETVQTEGKRTVKRKVEYYDLDLILSIGYRVNSANATKFRQWATKTLREYIIKGYAINEKRLLEAQNKFHELQEVVLFLQKQSKKELLKGQETEILNLLADYSKTLSLLDQYDKGKLSEKKGGKAKFVLQYADVAKITVELKKELIAKKANVFTYDPIVDPKTAGTHFKNLSFNHTESLHEVIKNKDACLIVTNWKEFEKLTPEFIKSNMKNHLFIDGRGFFHNKDISEINYLGIGLGNKKGNLN